MSLVATFVCLLSSVTAPSDADALRELARIPTVQAQMSFSTDAAWTKAFKRQRLTALEAARPEDGKRLLEIAQLKSALQDDLPKEAFEAAAKRLEGEARERPDAQAALVHALVRLERLEEAGALARRLVAERPEWGPGWTALSAVLSGEAWGLTKEVNGGKAGRLTFGAAASPADSAALAAYTKAKPELLDQIFQKRKEAREAAEKGVRLSPEEPLAYEQRQQAVTAAAFETIIIKAVREGAAPPAMDYLLTMFREMYESARHTVRLRKNPEDRITQVIAGIAVHMIGSQTGGEELEDVPGVQTEIKMLPAKAREELRPVLEAVMEDIAKLPPADRSVAVREVAIMFVLLGEPRKALETAASSAAALPDDTRSAIVHLDLLQIVVSEDEVTEQVQRYVQRLGTPEIRHRWIRILIDGDKEEQALAEAEKVLEKSPNDVFARLARYALELKLPSGEGKLRKNLDALRALVAEKIADESLRNDADFLLALHLGIAGERAEAEKILKRLAELGNESLKDEAESALRELDA